MLVSVSLIILGNKNEGGKERMNDEDRNKNNVEVHINPHSNTSTAG